jgi:hypothetical protein
LRITDLEEDAADSETATTSSIYDKLKKKTELVGKSNNLAENSVVERAVENTDRLRSILKKQD